LKPDKNGNKTSQNFIGTEGNVIGTTRYGKDGFKYYTNGKYSVDIWTPYRKSAADVAKAACEKGASPIREIDKYKPGYFWHYHPRNKKRKRKNSYIFYGAARG